MHTPVFLQQVIEQLQLKASHLYIDATVGEGGYLKKIAEEARVLAIDYDEQQIQLLKAEFKGKNNITFVVGNFAQTEELAKTHGFFPVSGIVFDLGLSLRQIEESGRGFSYRKLNEPLDMRLNKELEVSALELVNSLDEKKLYEIFAKGAEELNSLAIAQGIIFARRLKKIETVGDLVAVIDAVVRKKDERVYARVFQALRMKVNNELDNLSKGLMGGLNLLEKRGRMVIITFHSVEDRAVKQFIAQHKKMVNSILIQPREARGFERSAKLRVIEKIR